MDLPEIKKIKNKDFLLFALDILFLILPGIAAIFLFHRNDIFFAVDWVKLSLLSAALMVPLVFFNALLVAIFEDDGSPKTDDAFFWQLTQSTILTGFIFYILLVIGYFGGATFKNIFALGIVAEFIIAIIAMRKEKKREKAKKKEL